MNYFKIVFVLVVVALMSTLNAHPASGVELSFDNETNLLTVDFVHKVSDADKHFIFEVTVYVNKEEVITQAEFVALRDEFGHLRLKEGKYTPGQIDTKWTDEIKQDFLKWIDQNPDKLPMSKKELDAYLKTRTW